MQARSRTAWLLLAAITAATSVASPHARQAASQATGVIAGQVVDAGSGRGVGGALVVLTGIPSTPDVTDPSGARLTVLVEQGLMSPEQAAAAGGAAQQRAYADSAGRFVFRELTRGTYTIAVTMSGYSPSGFGKRQPDGPTRPLELADNQRKADVTIRLWKYAVISGTLRDEGGEPMIGVTVRAMRRIFAGGRPRLAAGGQATTDDRGMYRIASLAAADYVVVVPNTIITLANSTVDGFRAARMSGTAPEAMRQYQDSGAPTPNGSGVRAGDLTLVVSSDTSRALLIPPGDGGRMFVYPTVFYPGTTTSAQASAIMLGSAEERAGIDFALRPVPAARVTGTVSGPDGPAAGIGVRLLPVDADALVVETGFEAALAAADASGQFTFLAVPAGQYRLKAYRNPRPEAATPGVAGEPVWWAEMPVSVGDADITGLALMLRTALRVSGLIVFEGTAPKPAPQRIQTMQVTLGGVDSRSVVGGSIARSDAGGKFTTNGNVPGRYWLNVTPPGPEWTLKSVMAGGQNALEQPLILESTDISGVIVTFTDRVIELSGSVTAAAGMAADQEFQVLLFPADHQAWIANGMPARKMATARATPTGTFQMRVSLPGDYLVAAIGAEIPVDSTPQFYAALARSATRVSFTDGEKKSVTVTASRPR
jgi:hypothetical protein